MCFENGGFNCRFQDRPAEPVRRENVNIPLFSCNSLTDSGSFFPYPKSNFKRSRPPAKRGDSAIGSIMKHANLEHVSNTDDLLLQRVWFDAMAWQARTGQPVYEVYVSTWDAYAVSGDKYRYYFGRYARFFSDLDQAESLCRHLNRQAMDTWPDEDVDEIPVYSMREIQPDSRISGRAA